METATELHSFLLYRIFAKYAFPAHFLRGAFFKPQATVPVDLQDLGGGRPTALPTSNGQTYIYAGPHLPWEPRRNSIRCRALMDHRSSEATKSTWAPSPGPSPWCARPPRTRPIAPMRERSLPDVSTVVHMYACDLVLVALCAAEPQDAPPTACVIPRHARVRMSSVPWDHPR